MVSDDRNVARRLRRQMRPGDRHAIDDIGTRVNRERDSILARDKGEDLLEYRLRVHQWGGPDDGAERYPEFTEESS